MLRPEDVKEFIAQGMPCVAIEVDGDGHHFEALIVSAEFAGKSRVQRQQRVYQALGGRMESGEVHALSMRTLTPEEWQTEQSKRHG